MTVIHQHVGNTVCTWTEFTPLYWEMSEPVGNEVDGRQMVKEFDLSVLCSNYPTSFLLNLKDLLISRRHVVVLATIDTEWSYVRSILKRVVKENVLPKNFERIDETFLLALRSIFPKLTTNATGALRRIFNNDPHSPVFSENLIASDFPSLSAVRGEMGELTSRILSRAMTRATCVQVLRAAEDMFESKLLDIGQFSFLNLAFHIYCRPATYAKLTVSDLQIDVDPETNVASYFLFAIPVKSKVHNPTKICYQLTPIVGELLELQRTNVLKVYGHLIAKQDIGKLALFPSRKLFKRGGWVAAEAQRNFGAASPGNFTSAYLREVHKRISSHNFTFNDLRHTVGTQLAQAGCSAKTIQAVLKHASHFTCQAYVDIVFHGLVAELSDSLQPAFEQHFPVFDIFRSKHDFIPPGKTIRSENLVDGREDITGECGRDVACQYAPLSCYACPRFIPCHDADHSINLDAVNLEIADYETRGQPFRSMLNRAKEIRIHITLVSAASLRKLESIGLEVTP